VEAREGEEGTWRKRRRRDCSESI